MAGFSKEHMENIERENAINYRTISDEELDIRFGFHAGTTNTVPMHEKTRDAFRQIAWWVDTYVPNGPESLRAKAVCLTRIEEASMWANKAIANTVPTEKQVKAGNATENQILRDYLDDNPESTIVDKWEAEDEDVKSSKEEAQRQIREEDSTNE